MLRRLREMGSGERGGRRLAGARRLGWRRPSIRRWSKTIAKSVGKKFHLLQETARQRRSASGAGKVASGKDVETGDGGMDSFARR